MKPSVWAPVARHQVELVLADRRLAISPGDHGWWHGDHDLAPGTRYWFSIDGGDPVPDPRAMRLPDGPHEAAAVIDLSAFSWSDEDWAGVDLATTVIYELHVGTFTPAGTLTAAIDRLDHLVDLGVNLVEVMPVATIPGHHGWGYDGVGLYAVHEPYGGPEAFQQFIDACHARGLGVCLDVVYNHVWPHANHLAEFGPYFSDRHETPWGQAINLDGPGSDEVRAFILDNVVMWLRDFHVDALRLDAVHALVDTRAMSLLEEMGRMVDALADDVGRPLWLIAESDRNDPGTVTPRSRGGVGIHAQWADDVHHAWHVVLTGETQGYYADFAAPEALAKVSTEVFFHDGTWSSFRGRTHGRPVDPATTPGWRFVVSLQTHDQVGNRATGDRLSSMLPSGALACGAALLLASAGTPMLFMGEEWGASTPWQFFTDHPEPGLGEMVRDGRRAEFTAHGWTTEEVPDPQDEATWRRSRLDWDEITTGEHARLLTWYRALIRLRLDVADLRDPRLDRVGIDHDVAARTVLLRRGDHRIAINLGSEPATFRVGTPLEVLLAWEPDDTRHDNESLTLPPLSAAILGPAEP